jgi:hypothetical protein
VGEDGTEALLAGAFDMVFRHQCTNQPSRQEPIRAAEPDLNKSGMTTYMDLLFSCTCEVAAGN